MACLLSNVTYDIQNTQNFMHPITGNYSVNLHTKTTREKERGTAGERQRETETESTPFVKSP